jgi:hypothetical protein
MSVRAAASQGRCGERQAGAVTAYAHPTHAALLHHVLAAGAAPGAQPGMAAAQRRMARKGQLAARAKNPQLVIGLGVFGRQHEGGLGQVRPIREALHLLGGQAGAIEHHCHRIASKRHFGEDIDLLEGAGQSGRGHGVASVRWTGIFFPMNTVLITATANPSVTASSVSPRSGTANSMLKKGCTSCTWLTRTVPPSASPRYHAKNPIHIENTDT